MNESDDLPKTELSARIRFSDIIKRLEKISKKKSIQDKTEILRKFIIAMYELKARFHEEEGADANGSFFPFLRLITPKSDRERYAYGIRTVTLGKLYVEALAISKDSEAAIKLTSQQGMKTQCADYSEIVFEVMKGRAPETGSLVVYEVNKYLDLIAEHFKQNERKRINVQIIRMIKKLSALDQKWLTRIILKQMNLGLGHKQILEIYHPNALNYYNQYSYLSRVCEIIENNETPPQNGFIELFQRVRPMLCDRCNNFQIESLISQNEYYLETKMDGERLLVHKKDREFRYYSRELIDNCTTAYGSDSSGGNFSPVFYKHLDKSVRNAIFDGEMMVWNKEEQVYHAHAEFVTARSVQKDDPKLAACFVLFDILFLNDVSLIDKPYVERRRLLQTLVKEEVGCVLLCKQIKIRDTEHVLECMNNAFDVNEEGVVLKQADSKYQPGRREKGGWYKIKPDYVHGLATDFDLLIIGGYYNDRKTHICKFLAGVFKQDEGSSTTGVFYACCRLRSGLNREKLQKILKRLDSYWNPVRFTKEGRKTISHNPKGIEWGNSPPDVWIEPKNSIMLNVKATEMVVTDTYPISHALRFPRIKSIKDDKPWYECCNMNEYQTLCEDQRVGKLAKRQMNIDDVTTPAKKVRRNFIKITTFTNDIKPVDQVCQGLVFCILNTNKNNIPTVDQLKAMILKHGGRVVENPGPNTFVCIASHKSLKVNGYITTQKYDIAKVDWLIKALATDEPLTKLQEFHPNDMIFTTEKLKLEFIDKFDAYGDSYTIPTSEDEVRELVDKMDPKNLPILQTSELFDMEKEIFGDEANISNFFRLVKAYFCDSNEIEHSIDYKLSKFILRAKAGQCFTNQNTCKPDEITHIIVDEKCFNIRKYKSTRNAIKNVPIVSHKWIIDSNKMKKKLVESDYIVRD